MISTIIYDMDGTLIDSEPLWGRTLVDVLVSVGVPLTMELAASTRGQKIDEVLRHWFGIYGIDLSRIEATRENVMQEMVHRIESEAKPMAGALESIAFFKKKGLKVGLATGSYEKMIAAVLKALDLETAFDVICSAQHEKFGKPHPGIYLTAAEKLGASGFECCAIEDGVNGVISAKAARMKCIAVPEVADFQDKRYGVADAVLPSLQAIDEDFWSSFTGRA